MNGDENKFMELSLANVLEKLIKMDKLRLKHTGHSNWQISIIELVRTLDNYLLGKKLGKYDEEDYLTYYCYGWGLVLDMFYPHEIDQESAPLLPSNRNQETWAASMLYYSGKISMIRLCLDQYKTGLATVEQLDKNRFIFRYDTDIKGVEKVEREEHFWINAFFKNSQQSHREELESLAPSVHKEMRENVYTWKKEFLGYNTTLQIDSFYMKLAWLDIQKMIGSDSFPLDATFDGQTFEIYLSALSVLKSFSLRHLGFVTNQLVKSVNVSSINLVQYITLISDTRRYLSEALGIEEQLAGKVIDLLTLNEENRNFHCTKINGAMAPFLKISNNHIIYCHTGFDAQPVLFMLSELRRRYQKDWDRALEKREILFRKDIYSLFNMEQFLKIDRPIVIKQNGKVLTDIDAFIYDKVTGTLGLFQLKWQEPFADSMYERKSRKANFESESNDWIDSVNGWLENKTISELSASFGLKKNVFNNLNQTLLFVLGRNFSHFSGNSVPIDNAAWGMWAQVLRLFSDNTCIETDSLLWLYRSLKNDNPIDKAKKFIDEEGFELMMNGYSIEVI
ncbi:hypothetical protein D3C74_175000 [compost metagenome]